ncbi:translation elongation factor Ts [Candidatus Regiella insecticola]|uniref:Elongation factor Ts n=1 Tax=Candidatus Regiella insecticola TaxID=138073 RepID=A0A6L2ZN76_9ENTR|nr:translation elongation factor Ts [Candidatus Regiella insecticola]GFN45701.1 elongation factor Ts [Candidatus Regiella insecticola]
MVDITAAMVKELRERTGVGMMDCKKALVEAKGDIELSIDNMRKSGQAKAAKKTGRVAAEGIILAQLSSDKKIASMIELNCETDFVATNTDFYAFGEKVISRALTDKATDITCLQAQFEEQRTALVAKLGENIVIRRVTLVEGDVVGSYLHGGAKIGVIVAGKNADAELLKHIAMHITASKPEYLKAEDVPEAVVTREHQIQLDIAMQSGKPREIAEKMVEGRMRKFTGEISLTGQNFVMDTNKTVAQLLKEHNADVTAFVRYEVGEGIEKIQHDFAAEVAAMSASS